MCDDAFSPLFGTLFFHPLEYNTSFLLAAFFLISPPTHTAPHHTSTGRERRTKKMLSEKKIPYNQTNARLVERPNIFFCARSSLSSSFIHPQTALHPRTLTIHSYNPPNNSNEANPTNVHSFFSACALFLKRDILTLLNDDVEQ